MDNDNVTQVQEKLRELRQTLTLERASFSRLWDDPERDPLPKCEKEVDAFIRSRTALWRGTWVLPVIDEVIAALAAVRRLVERIAELEGRVAELLAPPAGLSASPRESALRRALYAGPEESTLHAAERTARELASTRDELTIERQARRAAAGRISEQAAQIAALEQRVGDADEEIRALGEHAADLARVAEGREATIATLRAHLADAEGGMRTALRMAERPAGERVS